MLCVLCKEVPYACLQYSLFITSHPCSIFGVATFPVARLEMTRGIVHYHMLKRTLPHHEIAMHGARVVVTAIAMHG